MDAFHIYWEWICKVTDPRFPAYNKHGKKILLEVGRDVDEKKKRMAELHLRKAVLQAGVDRKLMCLKRSLDEVYRILNMDSCHGS